MNQPVLMSINEFAARYRSCRTSTYEDIKNGRLKVVKRGRRTFIEECAAQEWLENLRKETAGRVA